jgi:hypothetical protein
MAHFTTSSRSLLLSIPKEIRQQVYELCIPLSFRVVVRQDMCSMVRGEGYGFQSKQETHGARDVPEDDSWDVIEETDAGSLLGSPILYGIEASSSRRDVLPELSLVCHQITDEIKRMLYRIITFTVDIRDGGEAYLASMFSAETLSIIATMTIITRTDILLFIYTSRKIGRYLLRKKSHLFDDSRDIRSDSPL